MNFCFSYLGCIYVLQARERFGWMVITETGPNDARCVVWAPGLRYVFIFIFSGSYILTNGFLFYLGCIYVLYAQEGFGWTAIMKTGPKNIRHVFWALGTIFLIFNFFSRVLYILTDGFLFYLGCIYVLYAQEGFGWTAITTTGPNDIRHIVWALGTIFLIFNFFSHVLYILTNGFLFYLGCIYVLQAQEGFGWTAMTKTGPNDARHIVWA